MESPEVRSDKFSAARRKLTTNVTNPAMHEHGLSYRRYGGLTKLPTNDKLLR